MEERQREHIEANIHDLARFTTCNSKLLESLFSSRVLTSSDRDQIESASNLYEGSVLLYNILQTKTDGYGKLLNALTISGQTHATDLLLKGIEDNKMHEQKEQSLPVVVEYSEPLEEHSQTPEKVHRIKGNDSILSIGDSIGYVSFKSEMFKGKYGNAEVIIKKFPVLMQANSIINKDIETLLRCGSGAHDNIVKYFNAKMYGQQLLLAMEVGYTNLEDSVKTLPSSAGEILHQAANGLKYLHLNNVIHGNLKPENVLIKMLPRVSVKLSEFGMLSINAELVSSFLESDMTVGVLDWMSPELIASFDQRVESPKQGFQSDIFALGCIFYYTCSRGSHPFGNIIRRVMNIMDNKPTLKEQFLSKMNKEFLPLISLMISFDPYQRPTLSSMSHHPVFWPNSTIIKFLRDVIETSTQNKSILHKLIQLETDMNEINMSWILDIDPLLRDLLLPEQSKYSCNIINVMHCILFLFDGFSKLSKKIKVVLGSSETGVVEYFKPLFPYLLTLIWITLQQFKYSKELVKYYSDEHMSYSTFILGKYPGLRQPSNKTIYLKAELYKML